MREPDRMQPLPMSNAMPSLDQLADGSSRPEAAVEARIREVAAGEQDPYWVHYQVRQDFQGVTIGEVAWVLTHS